MAPRDQSPPDQALASRTGLFHRLQFPSRAVWLCGAVALLSLWLRAGFPLLAIGPSVLDDALFLRLAQALLSGQWLGAYDNATLAKGMFYPLFIALSFLANIPLKAAEQLVYLGVCAWISAFVARRAASSVLGAVLFIVLALNPVMWVAFLARVIREGLYVSLCLLLLGLFVAALFQPDTAPARKRVLLGVLAGFVTGCFWLTREEGPWILPAIATCVVAWAIAGPGPAGDGTRRADWRGRLRHLALVLLPAVLAFGVALGLVKAMNQHRYGVFETTEFQSSSFQRGYGALARIKHAHWQRYVVFPADARRQAYAVSSAARELEPYLDGPIAASWRAIGCEQTNTLPCPEILSGWFMWALRDAVAQAGHYRTAPDAMHFYERLADEIDAACRAGKLDCLPPRSTLAPPFRAEYLGDMAWPALVLAHFVFRMGDATIGSVPSSGSPDQLAFFAGLTGDRLSPAPAPAVVAGWAAAPGALPEVALYDRGGKVFPSAAEYAPAPDVAKVFPGAAAVRFRLRSQCPVDECTLRVRTAQAEVRLPLHVGPGPASPDLKTFIDSLEEAPAPKVVERRQRLQQAIAAGVARVYAATFPFLAVLAFVGVLAAAVRREPRQRHGALLALATASLVAVFTRIALLAYLDATSIPSANGSYATPVAPLLIVFVVVGLWLAWRQASVLLPGLGGRHAIPFSRSRK